MRRFEPRTIRPTDGGRLAPDLSHEVSNLPNYVSKINWRRDLDKEKVREGHVNFRPNMDIDEGSQPNPGTLYGEQVTATFTARRPNGQRAFIACTPTRVLRYFALSNGAIYEPGIYDAGIYADEQGEWLEVGSGFSPLDHRWEGLNINGYLVLNNGVDLPMTYRVEEYEVKPIYELREQGIAAVETIAEISGILCLFDISELKEPYLDQVLSDAYPYDVVTNPAWVTRTQFKMLYCGIGEPRRWGAVLSGSMTEGGRTVTLKYATRTLKPLDVVLIQGAGVSGGFLEATIRTVDTPKKFTVFQAAVAAVTDAPVFFADASELAPQPGSYLLQDKGDRIIRGIALQKELVVIKEGGFLIGTGTGLPDNPFTWRVAQRGTGPQDSIYWRWTLTIPKGNAIEYAGRDGFYSWDLTTETARPIEMLMPLESRFFTGLTDLDQEDVFMAHNQLTQEIWFARPERVIAQDILFGTASEVDLWLMCGGTEPRPEAGATPGPDHNWFVLVPKDDGIKQYGLSTIVSPQLGNVTEVFTRSGANYVAFLETGWGSFGDMFDPSHLRSVLIHLATQNLATGLQVILMGSDDPTNVLTPFKVYVDDVYETDVYSGGLNLMEATINRAEDRMIPVHFLNHYFKLILLATGAGHKVAGHTWEVSRTAERAVAKL